MSIDENTDAAAQKRTFQFNDDKVVVRNRKTYAFLQTLPHPRKFTKVLQKPNIPNARFNILVDAFG